MTTIELLQKLSSRLGEDWSDVMVDQLPGADQIRFQATHVTHGRQCVDYSHRHIADWIAVGAIGLVPAIAHDLEHLAKEANERH